MRGVHAILRDEFRELPWKYPPYESGNPPIRPPRYSKWGLVTIVPQAYRLVVDIIHRRALPAHCGCVCTRQRIRMAGNDRYKQKGMSRCVTVVISLCHFKPSCEASGDICPHKPAHHAKRPSPSRRSTVPQSKTRHRPPITPHVTESEEKPADCQATRPWGQGAVRRGALHGEQDIRCSGGSAGNNLTRVAMLRLLLVPNPIASPRSQTPTTYPDPFVSLIFNLYPYHQDHSR